MTSQQSLHVAARCCTCRFELGHHAAATNDRVDLSAMLDAVEKVGKAT